MSQKLYRVASEEGAQLHNAEVGDELELNLDAERELALIAAGWLEPVKAKKGKEG